MIFFLVFFIFLKNISNILISGSRKFHLGTNTFKIAFSRTDRWYSSTQGLCAQKLIVCNLVPDNLVCTTHCCTLIFRFYTPVCYKLRKLIAISCIRAYTRSVSKMKAAFAALSHPARKNGQSIRNWLVSVTWQIFPASPQNTQLMTSCVCVMLGQIAKERLKCWDFQIEA